MYRTDPIPHLQDHRNAILNRRLRTLVVCSIVLLIGPLAALIALKFRGDRQPAENVVKIIGPDGSSVLGAAAVVSASFVLTAVPVPAGSQVALQESDRIPATKVRTEAITPQTSLTLLRLSTSASDSPTLSAAQNGGKAYSLSLGGDRWEGSLVQDQEKIFLDPQPAMTSGPGALIYSADDRSLIGMSVQSPRGVVVVSMKDLLLKFPEIQSAK